MTTLSQYFSGIAYKRLSAVEAVPSRSNQHEFNGTAEMKRLLGVDRTEYKATFLYVCDETDEMETAAAFATWYDSRENHATRSEYRLYFPSTPVSECAAEGDLLVIGKRSDGTLLILIVEANSTVENQVRFLFDIPADTQSAFELKSIEQAQGIDLPRSLILEQVGIEVELADESYLEQMLLKFPEGLPDTRAFSAFARSTLPEISSLDGADAALLAWWNREELLFKTYERHTLVKRLEIGFGKLDNIDVEGFIDFSKSVHQVRRSRAGRALENHLETIWEDYKIQYDRGKETESNSRPDFIFPGIGSYHDNSFPTARLSLLGVKSTCKDRWRQVLAEANRIEEKHLFTLETAISTNQTGQMQDKRLRLVVPRELQQTFLPEQRAWLLCLSDFIDVVKSRERV